MDPPDRDRLRPSIEQLIARTIAVLDGLFIQQMTNPRGDYESLVEQVVQAASRSANDLSDHLSK